MNKRNICFIVLGLCYKTSLRAQYSFGLEGGLSINRINTNISNRAYTELSGANDFSLGFPIGYRFSDHWFIEAIPSLIHKDFTVSRTTLLYGALEQFDNSYIQLPLCLGIVMGRRLKCTIDPGIYAAYWLSGRVRGAVPNIFGVTDSTGSSGQTTERFQLSSFNDRYHFKSGRDNRWEFGWVGSLGMQYRMTGNYWVTTGIRYYQSMTSREKAISGQSPYYNRTWTFSIGGLWNLKGR